MKAILPHSTYSKVYKSEENLPKKQQTIFIFRHISMEQDEYLTPIIFEAEKRGDKQSDADYVIQVNKALLNYLHFGLVDVKNLEGEKGPIKLERDESAEILPGGIYPWKKEIFEYFSKEVRTWMISVIQSGDNLVEEELKN